MGGQIPAEQRVGRFLWIRLLREGGASGQRSHRVPPSFQVEVGRLGVPALAQGVGRTVHAAHLGLGWGVGCGAGIAHATSFLRTGWR